MVAKGWTQITVLWTTQLPEGEASGDQLPAGPPPLPFSWLDRAVENMDRPGWREIDGRPALKTARAGSLLKNWTAWRDLMIQESAIADLHRYGFELVSGHGPDLMASDPTRSDAPDAGHLCPYEGSDLFLSWRCPRAQACKRRALRGPQTLRFL
jgi:hypothetical protein